MLEYILEQTEKAVLKLSSLSKLDKFTVFDEVTNALNQTRIHIRDTRNSNIDQPSSLLANIWLRASRRLRNIKNEDVQKLVGTIEEKSKYWSDPISYNKEDILRHEMQLTQVEDKLKKICG